jgi:hypothetical protein
MNTAENIIPIRGNQQMTIEAKPRRKPIGKKLRFEVFKRDGFTCQYCGSHPPSAVLNIDHIEPVALGGGNDIDNLITACSCCNSGKGATPLSKKVDSIKDKHAILIEANNQLMGYQETVRVIDQTRTHESLVVASVFSDYFDGWMINDSLIPDIKQFVKKLGFHEVKEAMEIACSRKDRNTAFRYFCGICWNKIRGS